MHTLVCINKEVSSTNVLNCLKVTFFVLFSEVKQVNHVSIICGEVKNMLWDLWDQGNDAKYKRDDLNVTTCPCNN